MPDFDVDILRLFQWEKQHRRSAPTGDGFGCCDIDLNVADVELEWAFKHLRHTEMGL